MRCQLSPLKKPSLSTFDSFNGGGSTNTDELAGINCQTLFHACPNSDYYDHIHMHQPSMRLHSSRWRFLYFPYTALKQKTFTTWWWTTRCCWLSLAFLDGWAVGFPRNQIYGSWKVPSHECSPERIRFRKFPLEKKQATWSLPPFFNYTPKN